jgi:hypothetical protein
LHGFFAPLRMIPAYFGLQRQENCPVTDEC